MVLGKNDQGGVALVATEAVLVVCGSFLICLRIWAVYLKRRSFRIHDYLAFASLPFAFALSACEIIAGVGGSAGQHIGDTTDLESKLVVDYKAFVAASFVWLTGTCLIKLSLITLFYDIFETPRFRKACFWVAGLIGIWFVALILNYSLICRPFAKNFHSELPGHCGNSNNSLIAQAASCLVMDAILTVLPMPVLWRLQMPIKKKLGIMALFSLSAGVCVVNALRIAYTTINVEDFTYTFMVEGIMACFELYVGITIACLPTLRPVFSLLLNRESWTFLSKDSAGTAGDDTTGSTQKLHPKSEPQKRNWFDHDDQYLLQDMGNKQKAPQTFTNASGNEPSSQESFAPTHPDGINMRKDVDIYASLASPQPLGHTASPADMA